MNARQRRITLVLVGRSQKSEGLEGAVHTFEAWPFPPTF
jgi:hypothetical protein